MRAGRLARLTLCWLLAVGISGAVAQGQTEPLSKTEIVNLLQQKVRSEEIAAEVRARGINFKLSPEIEEELRTLKAERVLLEALSAPARLELRVTRPDAELLLDGQKHPATVKEGRLVVDRLPPGTHLLRVRARHQVDRNLDVFLKPGETRVLDIEFTPAFYESVGPLGTRVTVQAGTVADGALVAIERAQDANERIQLLEKLRTDYADTPMVLLAYQMLQDTHLSQQQFNQSLAAGEAVLERDPNNFLAWTREANAYVGLGQLDAAFERAVRARELLDGFETRPVPEGTSAQIWEEEKQRTQTMAANQLASLAYGLFAASSEVPDPATKVALLERFLAVFPDSTYKEAVLSNLAFAYQQLGGEARPKMLAAAEQALALREDNVWMILLLADSLGERGERLGEVEQLANRALALLSDPSGPARPVGWSDEQWETQRDTWQGLAHFCLGEVRFHQQRFADAIKEFRSADALLGSQPFLKARNQYWLGYSYARAGQFGPARTVLGELLETNTPFKGPAQELLDQISRAQKR